MKKDIHPAYHEKVTITCSCGHTFATGSTENELQIEVCSDCHPFYTGKTKLVDAAGRVDTFRKKLLEIKAPGHKRAKRTAHKKAAPKSKSVKIG